MASIASHPIRIFNVSRDVALEFQDCSNNEAVSPDKVLGQLSRMVMSATFIQSKRLCGFLRFTVQQTLLGHGNDLKEYIIGTTVYERRSDFDPAYDTIVRTEARRLRKKLQDYYLAEGRYDDVFIGYRLGSYTPVFHRRTDFDKHMGIESFTGQSTSTRKRQIGLALAPFQALCSDHVAGAFAFGISEELLHRLARVPGLRAFAIGKQREWSDGLKEQSSEACETHLILSGSVRSEPGIVRVHSRLTTPTGRILWSERFDAAAEPRALLTLQETVASSILHRVS